MTHGLLSRPVLGISALAIAAALFGGGLVTGNALSGDDDPPEQTLVAGQADADRAAGFGGANGATAPAGNAMAEDMAARGGAEIGIMPPYGGGCAAPLDPAIADGFDLSAGGLTPRTAPDGFDTTGVTIRSEGECDDEGNAVDGEPVIEYQWRHRDSGIAAWVSQRAEDDPLPNMRYGNSATFTVDGEVFMVNAWGTYYPAAAEDGVTRDSALPYPQEEDPRVAEVLDAVIGSLAPSLPDTCFYVQTEGDWSDLEAFGVGDPRPAIPSGLTEQQMNVNVFEAPPGDCEDNGAEAPGGESFWASFHDGGSTYLDISVYHQPEGDGIAYPAYIELWGANWSSNGYGYSVNGSESLGTDTILAIAKALDPSFDETCVVAPTGIDESALADLGLGVPVVPDGFTLADSRMIFRGLPEGCEGAEDPGDQYEFSWSYEGESEYLQVNVSVHQSQDDEAYGYIGDHSVEWSHDAIYGSIWMESGEAPGQDLLEAIALSVDPGLDVSTLEKG